MQHKDSHRHRRYSFLCEENVKPTWNHLELKYIEKSLFCLPLWVDMIGQLLSDRYKIISPLGAGGMGQTYVAEDTQRPGNPQCVVKQLKPASNDPNFLVTARRLFTGEAEILEKLGSHDQIPRLLAHFEKDEEFYVVQEFIDGHPLSQELPLVL